MKPFRGLERYLLTPVGEGGGAGGPAYPINVGGYGLVEASRCSIVSGQGLSAILICHY